MTCQTSFECQCGLASGTYPVDDSSHSSIDRIRQLGEVRGRLSLRLRQDLPLIGVISHLSSRDKALEKAVLFAQSGSKNRVRTVWARLEGTRERWFKVKCQTRRAYVCISDGFSLSLCSMPGTTSRIVSASLKVEMMLSGSCGRQRSKWSVSVPRKLPSEAVDSLEVDVQRVGEEALSCSRKRLMFEG